jgi:hypothetical protein
MKLILSTDGTASEAYISPSSTPDIEVQKVEEIRHASRVYGPPTHGKRDTVHIELTPNQAFGIALDILTKLSVEGGTIAGWNISFPEREVETQPEPSEPVYGSPVYEVPDWTNRTHQRVQCGRHGIRYQQDTRHAAWIRREAKKRGLKASVSLGDGVAHVRLWPV